MASDAIDVRSVRDKLRLTQEDFAGRFGIPVAVLRNWEQRRHRPRGAARTLLRVIEQSPEVVEAALAA